MNSFFVHLTSVEGLRMSSEGLRASVEGLTTSPERPLLRRRNLNGENDRDYHNGSRVCFSLCQDSRHTLIGSWPTSCMTSFPSASYMIGFASSVALHTLRRMVVLPAFALPMTRMRNWGHSRRISAGPKAPSLNGRALLGGLASWFSADMAGEEKCAVSLKTRWWSEISQWCYRFKNRVSFSRRNT